LAVSLAAADPPKTEPESVHGDEHAKCRTEIRDLEKRVRELKRELKKKNEEIGRLKSDAAICEGQIDSWKTQVDQAEADAEAHAAKCPLRQKQREEAKKHAALLAKGKLFNGMTVAEANEIMRSIGAVIEEDGKFTTYEWKQYRKRVVSMGSNPLMGQTTIDEYSGSILAEFKDGKLTRWWKVQVP